MTIRRIHLRDEPLVAAIPCGHPLSEAETLSLQDLVAETLILFPKGPRPNFADLILQAFHDRGLTPDRTMEARELQISLGLVAAGMGVAIAPQSVLGIQRRDVVFKPFNDARLSVPIFMHLRADDDSAYLRALLQQVYELYQTEGIPHYEENF